MKWLGGCWPLQFNTMYGGNLSGFSREFNEQTDVLSGIMDDDDGYVNPAVFAWLDSIWEGALILLIDLLIVIMVSFPASIADVGILAPRQSILSPLSGVVKTTCGGCQ